MATPEQRNDVNFALNNYRNGVYPSMRKAAEAWDVPKSTLTAQNCYRQDRSTCYQDQQKLSPVEENALVDYVQRQMRAGYPLSVEALR